LKKNYSNIAITGSSGFVGSHLINKLINYNNKLFLITNRPHLIDHNIFQMKNVKILKGNLGQKFIQNEIISNKVQLIINLYAQTDLYFAEQNIIRDYNINVLPLVKFFSYITKKKYNCTFIQIGTVTQAGLTPKTPVDENFIDNPITVFDYHKLCAENHVKFYNKYSFINSYCFRLSNVYGSSSHLFSATRGVINKVIETALKNQSIAVYGDGNYLRDYIHIDDVINIIIKSFKSNESFFGKHILLCYGKSYTLHEVWLLIAKLIKQLYSIDVEVNNKEWPSNYLDIEKRDFVANNSLLVKGLGLKPKISLSDGLLDNIKNINNSLIN